MDFNFAKCDWKMVLCTLPILPLHLFIRILLAERPAHLLPLSAVWHRHHNILIVVGQWIVTCCIVCCKNAVGLSRIYVKHISLPLISSQVVHLNHTALSSTQLICSINSWRQTCIVIQNNDLMSDQHWDRHDNEIKNVWHGSHEITLTRIMALLLYHFNNS